MSTALHDWTAEHFRRSSVPVGEAVTDIADVTWHPTRPLLACTLTVTSGAGATATRVAVVDADSGAVIHPGDDAPGSSMPAFAPAGDVLASVIATDGGTQVRIVDHSREAPVEIARSAVGGAVESFAWSPDGRRMVLVVAEFGAEMSDLRGSGIVDDPTRSDPSWTPRVYSHAPGRRSALVWEPQTGSMSPTTELNVWEATWIDDSRLLLLAGEGPGEDDWYHADLVTFDLRDATQTTAVRTDRQLAGGVGSPDGAQVSVIAAIASDRGLVAGTLMIGRDGALTRRDVGEVDVTAHAWIDDHTVAYIGIRRQHTVIGHLDTDSGATQVMWVSEETSGRYQPEFAVQPSSGRIALVVESHLRPPTLATVDDSALRPLLACEHPGADRAISCAGAISDIAWTSADGTSISGFLIRPDRPGPLPLVINIHGGPVAAWRNSWCGRDPYTSLLVARGYAVLRPNPRGSSGRGDEFAAAVIGDMGGHDVDDITSAVAHLVTTGVVDELRVGITGNSYGGYMSAWIPTQTDVITAAVARSPVTDWTLQHLTTNIPGFDARFVGGDPFDPTSPYVTRSPLAQHHRSTTPLLLTAGGGDLCTPPSQALVMYSALRRIGVPTDLVIYPEEGHGVHGSDALIDQCARMLIWFDRYMPATAAPTEGSSS